MNREKWRAYIESKGLNPRDNRRKFGGILLVVTVMFFLLFIIRFVYVVGVGKVSNTSLNTKTQQLYRGSSVVKAKRGTIYDRHGEPIAEDATSYSLYALLDKKYVGLIQEGEKEPEKLYVQKKEDDKIAKILKEQLNMDKAFVKEQLGQRKHGQEQVEFGNKGKNISFEKKSQIEAVMKEKKVKGLYFDEHPDRMYPNGVFASHLIGYAKLANPEDEAKGLEGVMGIESAYNKMLSGKDGKIYYQKDSHQNQMAGTVVVDKPTENGQDIVTTLDQSLQLLLEEKMSAISETYQPEDIMAVLMEAKTGNILAASQRPSFNPETKEGLEEKDGKKVEWRNLLVAEPFEPGSTMKVFTTAAAVDLGVFDENAGFEAGKIQVADATISDHDFGAKGPLTYRQALSWSSNVGMVRLEQMMGQGWQDYLKRFKFNQLVGTQLPGESKGFLQNGTSVDRAMTAFGQGVATTVFQLLQGFSAIANEGVMLKPQYISKTINSDGTEKKVEPEKVGEPITANTANKVLDMMTDVVEDPNYGTGYGVYGIDGYRVSAKTGTAQISVNGAYLKDQYVQSVVQIAPTENPEYIMYVAIKKPPMNAELTPSKMVAEISNTVLKRALDVDAANQQANNGTSDGTEKTEETTEENNESSENNE